ncbi:MAG: hypothetical protein EXR53_05535 [Dehalococcoidia bacterium]|nr:hypothetical protein [Dehalococcoidia bacterium]
MSSAGGRQVPQAVLLGTENRAKQERLAWLLEDLGLKLVTPSQAALAAPWVEEDGLSHRANATAKAVAWSVAYGGMAIASDGGLVVPALGHGWDSLKTRRFFEGDDLGRARELLSLMAHLEMEGRHAYWVEAVVVADRGRLLHTAEGRSGEGIIALEADDALIKGGFWIGAVWYFPQLGKRYAEMNDIELAQVGDHWSALKGQARNLLGQH